MFERYIIVERSLRNIEEGGAVTGFAFDVRLAYYRGLLLSMVEGFEVRVDGEACAPESIAFQIGSQRLGLRDLETEAELRWEFDQPASLFVARAGGLAPGAHVIDVVEILRISYMPEPARRRDTKRMERA